jgi:oxygen-independent coproporphyrinogen-3 oxidase
MSWKTPISIYIHWPFGRDKYGVDEKTLSSAYLKELVGFREALRDRRVKSIFFAGGSLAPVMVIDEIFGHINSIAPIALDSEITIETRPGFVSESEINALKALGVNRVSIGAQILKDEAIRTIEIVDKHFDNYSFDLAYARPAQTLKAWQEELNHALNYIRHHVSLNQFIDGSDNELEAEMFKLSREILEANGIYQYEISNYAVPGKESVHSLAYYNYDEYLGIGPGAQSRVMIDGRMVAISIEERPQSWLEKPAREEERLSDKQVAYEYIMMNLRKATGFSRNDFYIKFNKDVYRYLDRGALKLFQSNGWLQYTQEKVFVTKDGRIFLDKIVRDVIKDDEY